MNFAEFPKETEGWLGDLPDNWSVKALKYVVTYNDEVLPETTDPSYEIEYVDISSVALGTGIQSTERLTFEDAPSRARRVVRPGDTLISTVRTYLRAITSVTQTPENLVASTGFAVLRPGKELVPKFLGYFATANCFVDAIVAQSKGVSYPATNPTDVVRLPIALPPKAEQRAIASFLDEKTAEIDALIGEKRKLLELLAEKRAAIITNAVTKGLNPDAQMKDSGIDWLGEVPEHWDVVPFKWRCSISSGQVDPTQEEYALLPLVAPDFIEAGTGKLFETPSAEEQGAISGKYFFSVGTLLYSKIRPLLSKVCIAPTDGLCSADMYPITPSDQVVTEFLFYQFLGRHFTSFAVMESLRVAMPKVNREALGSFPLLIPPLEEQKSIVAEIEAAKSQIDATSEVARQTILRLKEYRASLITSAVTGKIKVV